MPGPPALARFVAFHEVAETASLGATPLSFAIVLARGPAGIVLVFNRWRRVWELPGGFIDAGESPRDCAARELREEAGCIARDLTWLGVTEVNDGRTHFGAVYRCAVDAVPDKVQDDEISAVAYWQPDRPPPDLGMTDAALLGRFGGAP